MQLNAIRFTALALALSGASLAYSSAASACTTDAWSSVTGAPTAAEPNTVKRYSGVCGMQPALAGSSFVTDDSPNGTTEAGLAVLDRDQALDELISGTIEAAARRGAELAADARMQPV